MDLDRFYGIAGAARIETATAPEKWTDQILKTANQNGQQVTHS
jgi:hypothetical protein